LFTKYGNDPSLNFFKSLILELHMKFNMKKLLGVFDDRIFEDI